jgi:hypothetical protein
MTNTVNFASRLQTSFMRLCVVQRVYSFGIECWYLLLQYVVTYWVSNIGTYRYIGYKLVSNIGTYWYVTDCYRISVHTGRVVTDCYRISVHTGTVVRLLPNIGTYSYSS